MKLTLAIILFFFSSLKNFGQNDTIYRFENKNAIPKQTGSRKVFLGLSMNSSINQNGLIFLFPNFQVNIKKNTFSIGPSLMLRTLKNNFGLNVNYQRELFNNGKVSFFLKQLTVYQNIKKNEIKFPMEVPNNTGPVTIKGKTVQDFLQGTIGFGLNEKITNKLYLFQDAGLGLVYKKYTYTFYEDTSKEKAGDILIKDEFLLLGLLNIGIEYYIK